MFAKTNNTISNGEARTYKGQPDGRRWQDGKPSFTCRSRLREAWLYTEMSSPCNSVYGIISHAQVCIRKYILYAAVYAEIHSVCNFLYGNLFSRKICIHRCSPYTMTHTPISSVYSSIEEIYSGYNAVYTNTFSIPFRIQRHIPHSIPCMETISTYK